MNEDARVVSVSVASARTVPWKGRAVRTGIFKAPTDGRVRVRRLGLEGDEQADLEVHGGPLKAVYAYPSEHYAFWREELPGTPLPWGAFGENLTVGGLDLAGAVIGERWRIGTALLEVAQPRLPCYKLGIRVADPEFPKRFLASLRTGAYLRIIEEGVLQAGDSVQIVERPTHNVTIRLLAESVTDPSKLPAILAAPQLPASWRKHAQEKSL